MAVQTAPSSTVRTRIRSVMEEITSNGSIEQFPDAAKWLMSFGMYLGRLELMSVLVLLLPRFWRG